MLYSGEKRSLTTDCKTGLSLQTRASHSSPSHDRLFLDSMGGGAWSFLVGGAICLVNSVNERDLSLLTSYAEVTLRGQLLRGTMAFQAKEV